MRADEDIIEFTLADSWGETHRYMMTQHPPTEGVVIAMSLASMVSEPILNLLASMITGTKSGKLKDLLDADVGAMLGSIEAAQIGPSVSKALASSEAQRMVQVDLVRYVARDGKPLDNETNFDTAFKGNYLELFKLALEVAKRNRFLPLDAISKSAKKGGKAKRRP
jgi:hypothetical protein